MDAFTLSDALLEEYLEYSPISSTMLGVPGRDHLWDDLSPEGIEQLRSMAERSRRELEEFGEPEERWEHLAWRVALDEVEQWLESVEHGDPYRDLNNIASPFQYLRDVFDVQDTSNREALATRLSTIGEPLSGYRETLEKGRELGLVASKRQVEAVAKQARVLAGDDSPFLRFAADETDDASNVMESAIAAARQAVDEFAGYLESMYLPDAAQADGVGRERYVRAARRFLGMRIDPEETYAWGWRQVADLRRQMIETAKLIEPSKSLDDVINLLKTDPARCVSSKEEFIDVISKRLNAAVKELDGTTFDIPDPVRKVDVKIAPQGGALGAYYLPPSEDFSRPGSVWWSMGDKQVFPLWDDVSTAYHEGFPGHHLQIGVVMTLSEHLSRLHRLLVWYPGYGEGWALYTEVLMNELGYLEKPDYVLGMLAAEMLRACRVAIDIGSHLDLDIPGDAPFHPGESWTFDLAAELLRDFAFLGDDYAKSEVTRYLGWPGQAIAYKVGERVMLELRDEFLAGGGDLKGFHARVLGSGAVGLDLLRELVLE